MPPLSNPRWERFVQGLFEGKPASAAYEDAGYIFNEGNAIRLKGNEKVQARLLELQEAAARSSEVTVQSLLDELEQAKSRAHSLDQLSAATTAIMGKAKLAGLLRDKVEIGAAGDFDACETVEAVAEKLLEEPQIRFRPVNEEDRQGLVDLLQQHGEEVQQYLAAINARPVTVSVVHDARRQRLLNGNGR